jgi:hypothetical protein
MNKNLREEILSPYVEGSAEQSYRKFADMPLSVLQRLIDLGFVELGAWNHCDGVSHLFLPFLERNPDFNAHGYVISESGNGKGIVVEGVECSRIYLTLSQVIDFANMFHEADDFVIESAYAFCWYD